MVLLTENFLELEFVIPSPSIEEVFSLVEKRVDFLFNVHLTRSLRGDSENAWLKLEGNGVGDINLAKEYIIAACCPEVHVNLILAPDSRTQLLGDSDHGCLVDEIEKRSGAYISVKEGGQIEIRGTSVTVALALSLLEAEGANLVLNDYTSVEVENALQEEPSVIRNDCNFDLSGEIVTSSGTLTPERTTILEGRTLSGGGNSTVPLTQGREFENTDQEKECAETADSTTMTLQKCEAVVGSGKGVENRNQKNQNMKENAGPEIVKKPDVRDRDAVENENPADESLRDYALKLGYSEANITLGLSKLGLSADKNSLVAELLKAESSVKQLEEGSSSFPLEKHVPQMDDPNCLRPIVIDGSNVAMSHGNQKVFSCRGIGITVDWFLKRNHHDIKVFVPSWRKESTKPDSPIINQEVLTRLEEDELLVWTPSRKINGRRVTCYDDRYIVKHAAQNDGIIVSNDTFRDLQNESHEWKKVIELRLLMYTFVNDKFMPPDDPLGRHGPTLDEFLKRGYGKLCPYGRKCTFGRRCKYLHPERNPKAEGDLSSQMMEPREGRYGEISRPERPLPPCPPEAMRPFHKPLPPTPADIPSHILTKPLPLPPWEFAANMSELFPPTLRTNQPVAVGQRRPTSDPLPVQKGLSSEVQMMDKAFQRTHSVPELEDQACGGALPDLLRQMPRRGSLPQVCQPPPYPSDIMARGRMALQQMPHDGGPVSGEWILQEQMFGRNYQFPPHYPQTPVSQASGYDGHQPHSIPSSPWGLHPFPHPPHHYPPHPQACQYAPGNGPFYPPPYGRTPYRGQHNGYFKSRAPPVMDRAGFDVTDNAIDASDNCSSHEEQRIQAYEKLCELFPDDGEKILKVMDKYSEITSVETLTQHLLEDSDI